MPVINLTASDIAKSKIIDAGWYKAKIVKVADLTPSKDKSSMNLPIEFEIKNNVAEGKILTVTFNSKAIGMITPLLSAVGITVEPGQINTDLLLGYSVDVHVVQEIYEGRLLNKIDGYLPDGKGTAGTPF